VPTVDDSAVIGLSDNCQAPSPIVETMRIAVARRRGRVAKLLIGAVAAVGFGTTSFLARLTYAGHEKHPVQALSIPQPLYQVVRRNLLQAGIMAPATAPPDATTSTS
jgi:hypothetical protein